MEAFLACLNTVLLFFSSVVVCTFRLIFGVLSFAFITYTWGALSDGFAGFHLCVLFLYHQYPCFHYFADSYSYCVFLVNKYFIQIADV